jgi:hypothetical protein
MIMSSLRAHSMPTRLIVIAARLPLRGCATCARDQNDVSFSFARGALATLSRALEEVSDCLMKRKRPHQNLNSGPNVAFARILAIVRRFAR